MSLEPEQKPVNLLKPTLEHTASSEPKIEEPQKKPFFASPLFKLIFFGLALLTISGFLFGASLARTTTKFDGDNFSLFNTLGRLVRSEEKIISGEKDDRINLLLLGVGGSGHDGPELTDTIIFVSFKPSTKELGFISIPRDLAVNVPGYGYRKINAVNALAEQKKAGSGLEATTQTISAILGEPIPYTIKIDFNSFAQVIDAIGGININIERSFTDETYPLDDGLGSVQAVNFTAGPTNMDGQTALIFARSRHGNNGEGSDFSRAARQQKIILAAKDKLLSTDVLLNPQKLSKLIGVIKSNITTNIGPIEIMSLAKYVPDINPENITLHVLNTGTGSLLYDVYTEGLGYGIMPYKKDWSDLQALADNIFKTTNTSLSGAAITTQLDEKNKIVIEIQNGTKTAGLAGQTAALFESSGFIVSAVGNSENTNLPITAIYDFTDGQKINELKALKKYLGGALYMTPTGYLTSTLIIPDAILKTDDFSHLKNSPENIDFLIILGEDATNLMLR